MVTASPRKSRPATPTAAAPSTATRTREPPLHAPRPHPFGAERFLEVHCAAPLEACEARDGDGVYARARTGEIPFLSGITAPYEEPQSPEFSLPIHEISTEDAVARILDLLRGRGILV